MAKKTVKRPLKKRSKKLSPFWIVGILLVIVVVGFLFWHHHGTQPATTGTTLQPQPVTNKGAGTTPTATSGNSSSKGTSSSSTSTAPSSTSTTSAGPPQKPVGAFVSNHKPGQNGSPLAEASDCVTSPGATCYISFVLATTTKTLPTETSDSTGTAYWNSWTPAGIGLTSGSWTVTAIASLGGQTVSTQDPNPLVVQ